MGNGGDDDDDLNDLWFSVDSDEDSMELPRWSKPSFVKDIPREEENSDSDNISGKGKSRSRRPGNPWERSPEYWEFRIRLLRDYYAQHGHIDVPYQYVVENVTDLVAAQNMTLLAVSQGGGRRRRNKNQFRLGQVVYSLRTMHVREQVQDKVPPHVIDELNQMGMTWSPVGRGRWPIKYKERLALWNNNDTRRDNAAWMWQQRYMYDRQEQHGLAGPITPDRVELLTEAGILPYKRPRALLRSFFDTAWQEALQSWKQESVRSEGTDVWVWEQLRMHDALTGSSSANDSSTRYLPNLLTGPRVQKLTECNFLQQAAVSLRQRDAIPPEQDFMALDMDWATVWSAMTTFHEHHNHTCITPQLALQDYESVDLYSASRRLLLEYKNFGQRSHGAKQNLLLNEERIQSLTDIGFFDDNKQTERSGPLAAEYDWWEQYHELRRYRDRFGTVQVSTQTDMDLKNWIEIQQERYQRIMKVGPKGNQDKESTFLSETHCVALSNLGVVFDSKQQAPPEPPARLAAEGTFVGRPPASLVLNRNLVGRNNSQHGGKHKDVVEDAVWMTRYREMKLFIEKEGHSSVPTNDGYEQLALWSYHQRVQYENYRSNGKSRSLTPQRIQLLKDIGFDFHFPGDVTTGQEHDGEDEEKNWMSMLAELVRYTEENGHCFVPADLSCNPRLGQWVHAQRQLFRQQSEKNTLLTPKQIKLLNDAGLDLEMDNIQYAQRAFQTLWDSRVAELKEFKVDHGHCRVEEVSQNPESLCDWSKYRRLQKWVQDQRRFYMLWKTHGKPSHLNDERIEELQSMGLQLKE